MATVLLIRHGRTPANVQGVLAGWSPGVPLDEVGRHQAQELSERLAGVRLNAIVTSPLERARETAEALLRGQGSRSAIHVDDRMGECQYGAWTGKSLKDLAKDPLWKVVQSHASAVSFPEGETMLGMHARAVEAVRDWNARLGDKAVCAVVSHGDVIKAVVADALGMHLDDFQRIVIDPCSVSVVRYTTVRPFVLRVNDTGGDLSFLARKRARRSSDAAVGGGSGES